MQGMCQGHGAAPTAWTVTRTPMIAAHKRKGHKALLAPILDISEQLVSGLFVDNTDLLHVNMRIVETVVETLSLIHR